MLAELGNGALQCTARSEKRRSIERIINLQAKWFSVANLRLDQLTQIADTYYDLTKAFETQQPHLVDEEWLTMHAQQRLRNVVGCRSESCRKAASEDGHGPIRQIDVSPSRRH